MTLKREKSAAAPAIPKEPLKPKGQQIANDIVTLLRAKCSLIWIVSREEDRVERYLIEVAAAAKYVPHTWDCAQGCLKMADGRPSFTADTTDIGSALGQIRLKATSSGAERSMWIMRDMHPFIGGFGGALTVRTLRNLAKMLPDLPIRSAQAIVILSPVSEVPPELTDHITVIEWPLPDRAEMETILDAAVSAQPDEVQKRCADELKNGARQSAIDAAVGLSNEEAASCYARSLVKLGHINAPMVAADKKRVITREGLLKWYDPLPGGLDAVGGLDLAKQWLMDRAIAYSPGAREYGLQSPRGVLCCGISGCGKSLLAKATSTAWNVPLIKFDPNATKDKFVGSSEARIRRALDIIDTVNRCVVWIDELEKSIAGATSGASDGGVSVDILGTILTWMQERKSEAFVFATANNIMGLPPELMRKGRFDEIFWVDLPTLEERIQILIAALREKGRNAKDLRIDLELVATKTEAFTGAEVASVVGEGMFKAFADKGREIETRDLLNAAAPITPLSVTMAEEIDKMREWAKGKTRRATSEEEQVVIMKPKAGGRRVEAVSV